MRKALSNDNVLTIFTQIELRFLSTKTANDLTVKPEWAWRREMNLVIFWMNLVLILKDQLPHKGRPLQFPRRIEIGNVPYDKIIAVDGQGIAFFEKPLQIRIMTRQCL